MGNRIYKGHASKSGKGKTHSSESIFERAARHQAKMIKEQAKKGRKPKPVVRGTTIDPWDLDFE
ncbi:MAG: hypothetical protein MRY79_08015 [Alphaproteobacteria bacterium]|nr:hypothetical protein [Alphaproteobacteria bacterium]